MTLLPRQAARLSFQPEPDDRAITSLVAELASLLAPPLCAACAANRPDDGALCEPCKGELATAPRILEAGPYGIDLAISASPFEGVAKRLVHGLKFGRRLALAGVAAEAMLRALPDAVAAAGVVPVPPDPFRLRWRGFDPAEELALAFATAAGRPFTPCLRRARGRRQVGRMRSHRLAGPPRVWAVTAPAAEVLLVDDVWTTGATLSACARALRDAGSGRIVALTLAHAL